MSRATELRAAIKATFYPFAESRGFVRGRSSALSAVFRRTTPTIVHVFDIQWDKYGAPRFVLNFDECSLTGVDMIDIGHVEAGDVLPGYCGGGRLQRKRGAYGWFKLRKPFLEALMSFKSCYRPDEVVQQAIDWFPEVEAWWAHKHEGPHIDIIRRAG